MSNKKTSQELNQYYFKSFILTRGSVSMLSLAFSRTFCRNNRIYSVLLRSKRVL